MLICWVEKKIYCLSTTIPKTFFLVLFHGIYLKFLSWNPVRFQRKKSNLKKLQLHYLHNDVSAIIQIHTKDLSHTLLLMRNSFCLSASWHGYHITHIWVIVRDGVEVRIKVNVRVRWTCCIASHSELTVANILDSDGDN